MFSKFFNFISNVFEPFRRNRQPGETVKRKRSVTDENDALEEGPTAHKRSRPCNVLTDSNFDLKNSNTATDLLPVFRFKKPGQPFIHELVKEPKTAAKENWIGTQGTEMKPTMSPASKKKFKAPSHCRSPVRRPSRPISLLDNDDDEPKYIKTLVVTPKAAQPPNPMPRKFQKKFQKPGESSGTSGRPSAPFNTPRSLNKNSRALNSFMKQYSVSRYDLDCKMMYKALLGSILKDPAKYPHFAPVNPSPSSSSVDLITLEESDDDVVEVSSFTLHPNVSLRDNRRTPRRSRPRVLDKIDLTDTPNPSSTTPVATVDITSDDDDDVQVVESPSSLANVPKLNTLEEALKKIPITQGNWINELTTNYKDMRAKRVLRRDKLEKECEALFKYSEHKVEELLAKEIKEHMKISESLVIDIEDEEEEEVEAVETVLPELTPTMLNKINAAMNPTLDQNQTMSVKFGYTIKRRDLRTLLGLNWLNDEVINFYMSLLMERSKQKDYPPAPKNCPSLQDEFKFDCFPRGAVTEGACLARGCCFSNSSKNPNVPICFYPPQYRAFKFVNITTGDEGLTAELVAQFDIPYPNPIKSIRMQVLYLTESSFILKFGNLTPPFFHGAWYKDIAPRKVSNLNYEFVIDAEKSGFQVVRKSNRMVLFNTQDVGGLMFSDQFVQMSVILPSKYIYGLAGQQNKLLLDMDWNTVGFFNHDSVPQSKINGYGFIPSYLCLEPGGAAHYVSFNLITASEFVLQPTPALTVRTLTDFSFGMIFSMGSAPLEALSNRLMLSNLPPYWSLGFHLSRFGYKTLTEMKNAYNRTINAGIPLDTQWADIDYMSNRNDFTVNQSAYKDLGKFVKSLHKEGRFFVPILDPGVSASEKPGSYPPFDEALKSGVLVMNLTTEKPFLGKVWNPKSTAFLDFTNPNIMPYYTSQLKSLQERVEFDGLWLDMNEPSNFLNGSMDGCPKTSLDSPPFVPRIDGDLLSYKTLCMSAVHYLASHYYIHTSYASYEAILAQFALEGILQKRPFVLSRSFSTMWTDVAVWTGDVNSSWDDMKQTIPDVLTLSLLGIHMVGSDICGFNGNTTQALCKRWTQLGAFYTFSRNHNSDDSIDQDPVALGEEVVASAKASLLLRYSLLPYLYTLFWEGQTNNVPVIQPMFLQFHKDEKTYSIHHQFMWGSSLLIAPALAQDLSYVDVYFPSGSWYNWFNNNHIESEGASFAVTALNDTALVFIRGGSIIPTQTPSLTTSLSRKNPFQLTVALDNRTGVATGKLFWDDGESLRHTMEYNMITFNSNRTHIVSSVDYWGYDNALTLTSVKVLTLNGPINNVTINGQTTPFNFKAKHKVLTVTHLSWDLKSPFAIHWE